MITIKEIIIEKAIIIEDILLINASIAEQQSEIFEIKSEIISEEFLFVKDE